MTTAPCQHHPGEAAVGICVHCRRPLCEACITKIDGVNHCYLCLAERSEGPGQAASAPPSAALGWWGFGAGLGLLSFLVWVMLGVLLPVGGPP